MFYQMWDTYGTLWTIIAQFFQRISGQGIHTSLSFENPLQLNSKKNEN